MLRDAENDSKVTCWQNTWHRLTLHNHRQTQQLERSYRQRCPSYGGVNEGWVLFKGAVRFSVGPSVHLICVQSPLVVKIILSQRYTNRSHARLTSGLQASSSSSASAVTRLTHSVQPSLSVGFLKTEFTDVEGFMVLLT